MTFYSGMYESESNENDSQSQISLLNFFTDLFFSFK